MDGSILARIGGTPLVPLRRIGQGLPLPVLVKCEHLNPGGSVTDRIALAIVGLMTGTLVAASGHRLVGVITAVALSASCL